MTEALPVQRLSTPYKMYVWRDGKGRWMAVAHARTVQEARQLVIEDATSVLGEADWSTPVTADMLRVVREVGPQIHYRGNAEAVLTSNGQLEETELYVETLKARIGLLEAAIRTESNAPLGPPPARISNVTR
jgi:hypothetical protein